MQNIKAYKAVIELEFDAYTQEDPSVVAYQIISVLNGSRGVNLSVYATVKDIS